MDIRTKYEVGDSFWVPRSRICYNKELLHFEGETWERVVPQFEAYVKKKIVCKIEVHINKNQKVNIQYYLINESDTDCVLSNVYMEEDLSFCTQEEALQLAQEYANRSEEYHGLYFK